MGDDDLKKLTIRVTQIANILVAESGETFNLKT
jgi:hypothetical protein